MVKKKKNLKPKRINLVALDLFTNGLYKMKVIPNKKKEQLNRKKFKLNKEISSYSSICFASI